MPAEIGSLYVDLTVDAAGYGAGLSRVERVTAASMGRVERQMGVATKASERFRQSVSTPVRPLAAIAAGRAFDSVNTRAGLLRGTVFSLTAAFGGIGTALTANVLTRYADSFTQLNNRLRATSNSTAEAAAKFELLQDVATRARSDIASTTTLFARLSKAQPDRDPKETLRTVETIQKALQLGGATAQEAASAAIQFSQAIASNRLGGEELRAVLETPLGLELARGLGVTIGEFRRLGTEGKLTADVLFGALDKIGTTIDQQFAQSIPTLENALTRLDSAFIETIGEMNEQYRVTRRLGQGINSLADNLDTILPVLGQIGLAFAGLFGGKLLGRAGEASVGRLFSSARAGIAATKTEVLSATAAVHKYREEFARLRDVEGRARVVAGGDTRALAEKKFVDELKRTQEEARRAGEDYKVLMDRQVKARERLAAVTGATSTRIVSSVNSIVQAEKAVEAEVQRHTELRNLLTKAVAAETRAINARNKAFPTEASRRGPAIQDQQGIIQKAAEATKARIAIERQLSAAQAQISAQSEAISQRRIALDKLEADNKVKQATRIYEAQKRLVAAENAVQEAQARTLASSSQLGVLDRRVVESGKSVAAGDLGSAVVARMAAQKELDTATSRLAKATRAATGLQIALRGVGAAFGSLYSFLGGPWGVLMTGVIATLALVGKSAADAAADIAESEAIIARELGKMAKSSDQAAESLRRVTIKEQIKEAEASLATLNRTVASGTDVIPALAADIDNLFKGRDDDALLKSSKSAVTTFEELRAALAAGDIQFDEFEKSARAFGVARAVPPEKIEEIINLTRSYDDSAKSAANLKRTINELNLALAAGPPVDGLKEARLEMELLRKAAADKGAPLRSVNIRGLDLQSLEELTDKEREIRQIRDLILADLVKDGVNTKGLLEKAAEDRARQIQFLKQLKAANFNPEGVELPKHVGLFGDVRRIIELVQKGTLDLNGFDKQLVEIAQNRGLTTKVAELRAILTETTLAGDGVVDLKKKLDDLERSSGIRATISAFREMREEVTLLRRARAAETSQQGQVTAAANELLAFQLMSEKEKRINEIKEQILSQQVLAGNIITQKIEDLAEARAKEIELFERLNQQTFDIGSLTGGIEQDPHRKSLNPTGVAGLIKASEIFAASEAVHTLNEQIGTLRVLMQEIAGNDLRSLFDTEELAAAALEIKGLQGSLGTVVGQMLGGNITATGFVSRLEEIRAKLAALGADDSGLNSLIDGLIQAAIKAGLLSQELLKANAAKNAIGQTGNSGASFTSEQGTAIGPNGQPIPVTIVGGKIEKSLYDMAQEYRLTQAALDNAILQEAELAAEAAEQRDEALGELRGINAGTRELGHAFQKSQGGTTQTGGPSVSDLEGKIALLRSEQGIIQANIQYKNLSEAERAAADVRVAQISLLIAQLEQAIAVILYQQNAFGSQSVKASGFAKGGAFKVGGAGGVDSRLVQFMASPNETVAVYTPQQWREMEDATGGDGDGSGDIYNYSAPVSIISPDPGSYRRARREIQRDFVSTLNSAARR